MPDNDIIFIPDGFKGYNVRSIAEYTINDSSVIVTLIHEPGEFHHIHGNDAVAAKKILLELTAGNNQAT
jgi:hypothetical protein